MSRYILQNSWLVFPPWATMFPNCLLHMPRLWQNQAWVILLYWWPKVSGITLALQISSSFCIRWPTMWSNGRKNRMTYAGTPHDFLKSVHCPSEAVTESLPAPCQDCDHRKINSSLMTFRNRMALFIKNICSDFNILQGCKTKANTKLVLIFLNLMYVEPLWNLKDSTLWKLRLKWDSEECVGKIKWEGNACNDWHLCI